MDDQEKLAGLGRSIAVAVVWCSVVLLGAVAVLVWAVSGDLMGGIGVGLFSAFWGGPGFGIMAGGASHALRLERRSTAGIDTARWQPATDSSRDRSAVEPPPAIRHQAQERNRRDHVA